MQVCGRCGAAVAPEQQACAACGALLATVAVASSAPAIPPEQRYLPAQPYVPAGQLYEATYLHPYVHDHTVYGEPDDGGVSSSDEEPTIVAGESDNESDPELLIPVDLVQQAFLRYLPQYATNPLAGALIGGAVAFLAVIVVTLAFLGVAGPLIGSALFAPLNTLLVTTPLPIQPVATSGFFAVIGLEHHASFTVNTTAGLFTLTYPLTTMLVIPALCLTLGGYIAAATDYTRRWRMLLARAAAIGPVYAVLLMLSGALFGGAALRDAVAGTRGAALFGVDASSLLLYSMLWGIIFGGLGGVIRLFGWHWRAALVALLMGRPRSPLMAGVIGAVAAIGGGLMLTFIAGIIIVATGGTSAQLLAGVAHANAWHNATPDYILVLSMPADVELFIFGVGGAFTTTIGSANATPITGAISVFDSRVPLPYLLLLIIPALVYFGGGHLAARLTRSPNQQAHLVAGMLVGVFGCVILVLLANVCGYSLSPGILATFGAQSSTGPDSVSTLLGSLIVGMICGLLGAFAFQPQRQPRRPPRPHPLDPLFVLYDRLTMQPIGVARPRPRSLLYLAITVMLTFAALGIVLELLGGALARLIGVTALQNDVALYGGAMLAVPALLLLGAWVLDLIALPQGTDIVVQDALPPPAPVAAAPPSAPYEYPIHPLTLPEMPQIARRASVPVPAPHDQASLDESEEVASR